MVRFFIYVCRVVQVIFYVMEPFLCKIRFLFCMNICDYILICVLLSSKRPPFAL